MVKRLLTIALVAVAATGAVYGQTGKGLRHCSAGVTVGGNLMNIWLSNDMYDIYDHHRDWHPAAGAFFQYRFNGGVTLRPEVLYYGRGTTLSREDVEYTLLAHCLGMRLGLRLDDIIPRTSFTVYGIVVPEATLTLGGEVDFRSRTTGGIVMPLSSSSMRMFDLGVFCGAGVELPLRTGGDGLSLSAEAGYRISLLNSFARCEVSGEVEALNYINLPPPVRGRRTFSGLELTLRVGLPFGKALRFKRIFGR